MQRDFLFRFFLSSRAHRQTIAVTNHNKVLRHWHHPWTLLWDHSALYNRTVDHFVAFFFSPLPFSLKDFFATPMSSQINFPKLEQYPLNAFSFNHFIQLLSLVDGSFCSQLLECPIHNYPNYKLGCILRLLFWRSIALQDMFGFLFVFQISVFHLECRPHMR